jgi:hypothetical protein
MSRSTVLSLSLSGPDLEAIVRGLDALGWLPAAPTTLKVDFVARKAAPGWMDSWLGKAKTLKAMTDAGHTLDFDRGGLVSLRRPDTVLAAHETFEQLGGVPFELAVIGQVHEEWFDESFETFSFGRGHVPHGWASALRGAGHARLVSRRWPAFGPWRLHSIGDASWVEFHDLAADAATALAEAQPGWRRMGISDTGGFLQSGFVYTDDVGGVYDPNTRKLKVMVPSGAVSQRKMLEIAAARRDPRIQKETPFEHTAFIFLDAANARRHLHELWLREHECWAIVDGVEQRLDEAYAPAPVPPGWVAARRG